MNIAVSPINYNKNSFRAIQMDEKKKTVKKSEKPLTYQEINVKTTKIVLSCCVAMAAAVNLLYFAMKRNMKYGQIEHKERVAKQISKKYKKPLNTFLLFLKNPENFGINAAQRFRNLTFKKPTKLV